MQVSMLFGETESWENFFFPIKQLRLSLTVRGFRCFKRLVRTGIESRWNDESWLSLNTSGGICRSNFSIKIIITEDLVHVWLSSPCSWVPLHAPELNHLHFKSQFSHSFMSNSLQSHGLQHARLPCPSPTPGAYSNSCPSSQWCHPTISSSVVPFSSLLQSFPASGSFPMSQFFTSGGQSFGVSVSASVLPMNIQDWFPLGLTGLILQSKGLSRVFSNTTFKSISSSPISFLYGSILTSPYDYWKNHSFD